MSQYHLIQADLCWEDPAANQACLSEMMEDCHDGVIVLPEMFSTGFSMASDRLAESMQGPTTSWMKAQALKQDCIVCGSQIIESEGAFYNRFIWADPQGKLTCYDKRHLFRMAAEHHHYAPGHDRVLISYDDTVVLPQVCYDLRFPAWSRNRNDYEVILYVANWPAARREHWLALLKARAIENLCYVIAVNRVGSDGNDIEYAGDSCVIDFRGELILEMGSEAGVGSIELDMAALKSYRDSFPAFLDADEFTIKTTPYN